MLKKYVAIDEVEKGFILTLREKKDGDTYGSMYQYAYTSMESVVNHVLLYLNKHPSAPATEPSPDKARQIITSRFDNGDKVVWDEDINDFRIAKKTEVAQYQLSHGTVVELGYSMVVPK